NDTRHRRADLLCIAERRLWPDLDLADPQPVRHRNRPRLTVEVEEDPDLPLIVGFRPAEIVDHHGLAMLDLGEDLLALAEPVEIDRRRQHFRWPVGVL